MMLTWNRVRPPVMLVSGGGGGTETCGLFDGSNGVIDLLRHSEDRLCRSGERVEHGIIVDSSEFV